MEQVLNMKYSTSISDLCEVNSSFDSGILKICYPGQNRNGSFISKESIENAIPTLFNCPIVCHYFREDDSLGGHDMEVISDNNNNLKLVNLTQPVGVIPESSNVFFKKFTDEDGIEREYLCAEALIWKRQEAYEKIKDDGVTAHSMEISVKSGDKEDDGLYHINDFEFTAFALIGVEPCFEGSSITMFSASDTKKKIAEMMEDLKTLKVSCCNNEENCDKTFIKTTSTPSTEVDSVENITSYTKGGKDILDERNELLKKYNLTVEDLDFEINDMTPEDLETALKEFVAKNASNENANDDAGAEVNNDDEGVQSNTDDDSNKFGLESEFRNELINVLESEDIDDDGYQMMRYWFVDYDNDSSEVYFVDRKDYLLYGAEYSVSGDSVSINYETVKRMKYAIVPREEGDADEDHIHEMFCTEVNKMKNDLKEMNAKLNNAESELTPLREFKASAEKRAKEEMLNEFSDLEGNEHFEEIKAKACDMSVSDIEEKCFALRGRISSAKVEKQKPAPKLTVNRNNIDNEEEYEPYHGAFKHFGFNN